VVGDYITSPIFFIWLRRLLNPQESTLANVLEEIKFSSSTAKGDQFI